ncbi:MAG: hypothetical protein MUC63_02970, partial [Planctomycetes bacterium]|jgi:hypothetical protein|nr:hypothetical protein [Planctomycetota bacterium]
VARNLALRFAPAAGVEGSFDSPVGTFRLQGPFDPSGRSSLRASSDRIEVPEGSPVRAVAGPVETRGRSSGAVTLSFGGGEPAVLTGTLSVQELELGEAGVRFSGALAVVRGREGPEGFALDAELRAAGVSAGGLSAERASLSLPGLSIAALAGEAALWRGKLKFRAAPGPAGGIEGTVEGADLALMPPGFLGAATPSRGALDARFAWGGGALEGSFEARDAELWNLPAFEGIRRLVPGVGRQEGLFRTAKGRFRSAGGVTDLPALELDGSGFGMSLARPGRVGPARKLDLDFELRLQRDDRSGEGLPPLRTLVDALGRALWKPIGKYFLFHVKIGGTLDAPTHELVAPLGLGK